MFFGVIETLVYDRRSRRCRTMENQMRTTSFLLALLILAAIASAQPRPSQATTKPMDPQTAATTQASKLSDKLSISEHELKIGDTVIKYKATAGYMTVKDESGKEKANFFFVAYDKIQSG